MHLYLAGPYRPFDYPGAKGTSDVEQNVARASDVAAQCFDAGHAPITPHLLTRRPSDQTEPGEMDHEFWLEVTEGYLRRCDAILLLPYWEESEGAKRELRYAERVDMNIYNYEESGVPGLHPTEEKSPVQVQAFIEQLMQMYRVHLSKNRDYSPANIHGTGEIGVAVRLWDKVSRLLNLYGFEIEIEEPASFRPPEDPAHEPINDTLLDAATYGVIGKLLRNDQWGH